MRFPLLLVIVFFMLIAFAYGKEQKEYKSPDGNFVAMVIPLPHAPYGMGESKIELRSTSGGKVLCSRSYVSKDGQHGFGVDQATWTPDSKFFVYSMSSSGGHQPWRSPIDFISIATLTIQNLDDLIGPIIEPEFSVRTPDIVNVTYQKKSDHKDAQSDISLDKLLSEMRAQ